MSGRCDTTGSSMCPCSRSRHDERRQSGAIAYIRLFEYYRNVNPNEVVQSLAALAHPVRLQVFRALVVNGQQGLTPGVIQEALAIAPATLSFHLKELMASGLVTQERSSRNLVYRAAYERMNQLLGYLTENCCQGSACAVGEVCASCKC